MTQTGSWVIAVGALIWFREIEASDRAFWAFWIAWSVVPLLALSLAFRLNHRTSRVSRPTLVRSGACVPFAAVILSVPETFRGLPVHALMVATIVFSWLRLAAEILTPHDGRA